MNLVRAEELAKYYMQKHGLMTVEKRSFNGKEFLWESGWSFEFCRSKRIIGHCDLKDKTIRLSKYHTQSRTEDDVVNTILHEIAHAVCPPVRVFKTKRFQWDIHHAEWRNFFLSIGGNGERCGAVTEETRKEIGFKYTYNCQVCGHTFGVHRLSKKKQTGVIVSSCTKCHPGKFNRNFLLTITQNY